MRPPRIPSFSYAGHYRYSLTLCTRARSPRFTDPVIVEIVLVHIRQCALLHDFALDAYCFMPDHLHLLCTGRSGSASLPRFVACAKQRSGFAVQRALKTHLWQGGYYDRVLRTEEDTLVVARYIVANPVRAGLCRSVDDYPFTGSDVYPVDEIWRA